ncbi:MAG: hypothetical protein JWR77_1425 [Rhizorhabdus sp.]|jgi:hypothetical protein|nr:hypothetical protein [Rhizorhabdus sp.]
MKKIWIALAGVSLASLACTAAQATFFSFDLVHWNGIGSPPADPAAEDYVHLIIDDSLGGAINNNGHSTGIWSYSTGTYLDSGYVDVDINLYNDYWGGGFTITPFTADGDTDLDWMMDIPGPSVLGGDEDAYYIQPGVYDYHLGFRNWARVTIAEAEAPQGVPEPAAWAMMVAGFGAIGAAMRRRQRTTVSFG